MSIDIKAWLITQFIVDVIIILMEIYKVITTLEALTSTALLCLFVIIKILSYGKR